MRRIPTMRIPWMRAAVLAVCATVAFTTPASATPSPDSDRDGRVEPSKGVTAEEIREARETERYWTPERIRSAVPVDAADGADATDDAQRKGLKDGGQYAPQPPGTPKPPGGRQKRSLEEPSHVIDEGMATVGVFLIRNDNDEATPNQFCTAASVASPTKSLAVTAAHCLNGSSGRNIAFVPGYRAGGSTAGQVGETPYGIFPVKPGKIWIDSRYLGSAPDDDVDFAFLRVGPNSQGQLLEDATGRGNTLTAVTSANLARESVTVIGYPGGQKTPLRCTNNTTAFQGRFMEIKCDSFRAGVSGGPFLENFDGIRGDLVGVIGGYKTGGAYDHTSYTSQFDDDVFRLYNQAVNDAPVDTGAGAGMGSSGTWSHARAMTAGRFHTASVRNHTSDLIVRWSDGEVSLYPGNGTYGFGKDIQLAKDETWQQAKLIAAGDFTGSGSNDLFVVGTDGRVTLYKDVNETNKLNNRVELRGPNGTWTHAVAITAGRFGGGNTRSDDLVVVWSDGEVTLYPNVDGRGVHGERQLIEPPDIVWPHARDLAAGNFNASTGNQDLFVRWSDGKVTVYENIADNGVAKNRREHQLQPDGSPWSNATLATVGSFGGPDRQDDIVALWTGGKLTLHADTTTTSIAPERVLVRQ
ncbi:trypsin-like serine peptidase [Streptomyces noursei]|uniref:trypsin-like serine peptidase n=1 Tax=Streptomyces noursei TaxID=1971 RepID=UPI0019633FBF|nr:trypsin-like peptidase domain-containing protein [Streptomyces noursei]QRX91130.1 trypsin-like peptidase domain-containing protein [Streptomyces noursei]